MFRRDSRGRFLVGFPDLPEAHTDGRDMQEAVEEAIERLGSAIAFRIAERSAIPPPSRLKRGHRSLPVPLWIAGRLALYLVMIKRGVNNSELARRLGVRETVVRRMLDPDHDTRSEKIQAALEVLGKRMVEAVEDAA
jgi:antitoxin HicB